VIFAPTVRAIRKLYGNGMALPTVFEPLQYVPDSWRIPPLALLLL
jgi:hypothetical protein